MPRKRKNAQALLKAKEAKQKKLLFVLVPIFLGLAVWQGPKMLGALTGGSTPPEATPVTATAPGVLADTDVPPEADVAKLISFSRFTGRDPFISPNGPAQPAPTAPAPTTPGSPGGGGQQEELTAVFEINGATETVSVGEEFPASDPTFTLVALTLEGATVGVVQGIFETGDATIKIAVSEQVELIAAPETTRFLVTLVDVLN